jgi:hypothetical protein
VYYAEIGSHGSIVNANPHQTLPIIESNVQSNCIELDSFVGNHQVKRLKELFMLENDSTTIILGWYDSVFEGIDMWYPEDDYCKIPRLYVFSVKFTNLIFMLLC